ncbi:signal peptidase I [Lactococcus kimchii]|uniref:signal peptidase I n=1 Tax=Lactococcus sp. S-13 TaxID=2507158 RepID=UPI001022A71D|nr:signal peptidase I [Lactococcus sp. S-13]RZI49406.1 signal peptidase I [Lactococcus sp. S-13]
MLKFLKEWGLFILVIATVLLSRIFVWSLVIVDGHSMDPTLADKERLIITKISKINRFDIVVAKEGTGSGGTKDIVKRVIGMPGDVVKFNNDQLTINNKVYPEAYLKDFQNQFSNKTLAKTYGAYPLTNELTSQNRDYFVSLAENTRAFTTDSTGNPTFTAIIPKGQYYLMGDNRVVSQDSRAVGTFNRSAIVGEAKVRVWPLNKIGLLE